MPARISSPIRSKTMAPRLINAVCDVALLAGYAAGSRQIDAAGIRKAIEHLEGTP